MSYDEFLEWIEFFQLEPFGTPADDHRWEQFLHLFWAANSDGKQKPPEKFIDWDPEETARLRAEREGSMSLDDKLRAFFGVPPA